MNSTEDRRPIAIRVTLSSVDVVIEGDRLELIRLAQAIKSAPGFHELAAPPRIDHSPRAGKRVAKLNIDHATGPASLRVHGKDLAVSGGEAARTRLADNIERFVSGELRGSSKHLHVEHFPEHPFLSETSTPLVVVLTNEDDAISDPNI